MIRFRRPQLPKQLRARHDSGMTAWEYKVVTGGSGRRSADRFESQLNDLGRRGWEAVDLTSVASARLSLGIGSTSVVVLMKREVSE